MGRISENLQRVKQEIEAARVEFSCQQAVSLLAVSKTFGITEIEAAYESGQCSFGENYVQEGIEKIAQLQHLKGKQWHMIGPLQSNKTRLVAEHFDWVQSVDRLKIAQRLSEQRPAHLPALQICIQVNIDGGANKSGCLPEELFALASAIVQLPNVRLRGIMCIPEPAPDFIAACAIFKSAKQLFDALKMEFQSIDTLSMGMSADLRAAVCSGSSMVRVGTAIFGKRD